MLPMTFAPKKSVVKLVGGSPRRGPWPAQRSCKMGRLLMPIAINVLQKVHINIYYDFKYRNSIDDLEWTFI